MTGGVFIGFAFVAAAMLESKIQESYSKPLSDGESRWIVSVILVIFSHSLTIVIYDIIVLVIFSLIQNL